MIRRVEMIGGRVVVKSGRTVGRRVGPPATHAERLEHEPWRATGYGPEYRRARVAALDMTGGRCASCGKVIARKDGGRWRMDGGEVHHAVPLAEGGDGPLVPLCIPCHRRADAEARRRRGGGSK